MPGKPGIPRVGDRFLLDGGRRRSALLFQPHPPLAEGGRRASEEDRRFLRRCPVLRGGRRALRRHSCRPHPEDDRYAGGPDHQGRMGQCHWPSRQGADRILYRTDERGRLDRNVRRRAPLMAANLRKGARHPERKRSRRLTLRMTAKLASHSREPHGSGDSGGRSSLGAQASAWWAWRRATISSTPPRWR